MVNIIDICIILIIIFGGVIGFKRGVIKQGVITLGTILVLVCSFILKNPMSLFMYKTLPFFQFDIIIPNATALNIIVYEVIAFLICFSILETILIIVIRLSSVVEFLLRATVILEVPSKILGAILGMIESYILVFIILMILSSLTISFINLNIVNQSKLKDKIISDTFLISKLSKPVTSTIDDISNLMKSKEKYTSKEFECESIKIMSENNFVTEKAILYLKSNNKINGKCNY